MIFAAQYTLSAICRRTAIAASALACSALFAQTPAPRPAPAPGTPEPQTSAGGRAMERIRTEDAGSRIDELRVGGETQQITVQPKAAVPGVPAYEVKPAEGARGNPPDTSNRDTNGSRVWNLFKF